MALDALFSGGEEEAGAAFCGSMTEASELDGLGLKDLGSSRSVYVKLGSCNLWIKAELPPLRALLSAEENNNEAILDDSERDLEVEARITVEELKE